MSFVICPLFEDDYYSYSIDLSGRTFTLTFRWSHRSDSYLMDIADSEGDVFCRGIVLNPLFPLMNQSSFEQLSGDFLLSPRDANNTEIPDKKNVHKSHFLVYDEDIYIERKTTI